MYDSYSEVERLDASKSMTRDEYTEFVIQRCLFLDKLKAEVARYDKIISQIDSLDSELVQAYRYKRHKVLALSKIPIQSPEHLEFYKWLYNGGKVRSKEEVEEAHEAIMEEKCRQMDMEFRRSADYHFQKTIFMILVILAVWFLPGWLFPDGTGFSDCTREWANFHLVKIPAPDLRREKEALYQGDWKFSAWANCLLRQKPQRKLCFYKYFQVPAVIDAWDDSS